MLTGYCYLYVIGMSAVKDGTQTLGLAGGENRAVVNVEEELLVLHNDLIWLV